MVSKTIDEAIQRFMAMSPEALTAYKPETNAEAVARKWVTTAISSEDEALSVRVIQLIAERTDGRATAGSRKDSSSEELLKEMAEKIMAAG